MRHLEPLYKCFSLAIIILCSSVCYSNLSIVSTIDHPNKSNQNLFTIHVDIVVFDLNNVKHIQQKEYYVLQAGAFSKLKNAEKQKAKIQEIVTDKIVIEEDKKRKLFLVHVGEYFSKEQLIPTQKKLNQTGIDHFLKRKKG
ncbi:MAG: SPOR domain-containing protein [Saprospiraceae bacterium]|nr:SPOR domain-containing protein [Saprospiraceae bacterium]